MAARTKVGRTVGWQLLDMLTAGMYSDPRMALREYVQNSADAIDEAEAQGVLKRGQGRIGLEIDGRSRTVTVEDNGIGVSAREVEHRLVSLGSSVKAGSAVRGFRGIGRLGGLAYCEQVVFETRAGGSSRVGTVTWDNRELSDLRRSRKTPRRLTDAVRCAAKVDFRRAKRGDPPHYFKVNLLGVTKFHSDPLMNLRGLADYLSQTAPVGYAPDEFSFAPKVVEHLSCAAGFRSYSVVLNGREIRRPYSDRFAVSRQAWDRISDIEPFGFQDRTGRPIGWGWYALTNLLAALPPWQHARGIRVRQGNIQVGDEYFLAGAFTERRFATWHIGEIHLDYSIRPNARRDGFEQSPEHESFLEQTQLLGRRLSLLCRRCSERRSAARNSERMLERLEALLESPLFVDAAHSSEVLDAAQELLGRLADRVEAGSGNGASAEKLGQLRRQIEQSRANPSLLVDMIDGRRVRHLSQRQLLVEVCRALVETGTNQATAPRLTELLAPYLRH